MGVVGVWRIVEMDLWDIDAIDLMEPGFVAFEEDGDGGLQFVAVQGQLDWRTSAAMLVRRLAPVMLGAIITHHDESQTDDGQRIQRCARDARGRGGPARSAGFGSASRGCRRKGASATREPAATRRRRALDRRSQRGRPHG